MRRSLARPVARLLAVLVGLPLATALVLVPGTARACACGAAYVPDGHTVQAGDELAFLSWAKPGQERLEMGLSLTADTRDLAVLVPTPAVPTVTQGDNETFDRLATLTAPAGHSDGDEGDGDGAAAPQAAPSVVSTTKLDDVVATVLKGGTPAGVTRWLRQHGYAQKPQVTPAIATYLRDGWVFTAIKMRGDRPFDGVTDPIVLTFASAQLVYPMRLSSTASEVGTVTVYTLDRGWDKRVDGAGGATATPTAAIDLWANSLGAPYSALIDTGSDKLTKFVYTGLQPGDLTADFTFAADPSGHEVPPGSDAADPSEQSGPSPVDHVDQSAPGSTSGDGPSPWLVGLVAFVGALVVGLVGLFIGSRRAAR